MGLGGPGCSLTVCSLSPAIRLRQQHAEEEAVPGRPGGHHPAPHQEEPGRRLQARERETHTRTRTPTQTHLHMHARTHARTHTRSHTLTHSRTHCCHMITLFPFPTYVYESRQAHFFCRCLNKQVYEECCWTERKSPCDRERCITEIHTHTHTHSETDVKENNKRCEMGYLHSHMCTHTHTP